MKQYRVDGEKQFTFSYNSPKSVQSPTGTKQTWITGKNKTDARKKIKEFIASIQGTLCVEYF